MTLTSAQLCLLAAALWSVLTVGFSLTRPSMRERNLWIAVMAGVPLIGWITYEWGPGPGVAGFLLGVLLVVRALAASSARHPGHPPPGGPTAPSD